MKKEDKQLLLQDLCARLPYGVKATTTANGWRDVYVVSGYNDDRIYLDCPVYDEGDDEWLVESVKPYLRPMSSMTEEEKEDLLKYVVGEEGSINFEVCNDGYIRGVGMVWVNFQPNTTSRYIGWLLKNHFDFCDLIPKGLALEAPKDMYNEIKEEKK